MTIQNTSVESNHVGNGASTVFAYGFKAFDETHIKVAIDGVVQPTDAYVVSGVGNDSGGSVTLDAAPAVDAQIRIYRDTPRIQQTDYRAYGRFPAETHERRLDYLTAMIQEIFDDALFSSGKNGRKWRKDQDANGYDLLNVGTVRGEVGDFDQLIVEGEDIFTYIDKESVSRISETPPEGVTREGTRWYKPSAATTYVWYYDESGDGFWVEEPVAIVDQAIDGTISFETTQDMIDGVFAITGQLAFNRERENAPYVLAPIGYVAQVGDVVTVDGRVWALQLGDDDVAKSGGLLTSGFWSNEGGTNRRFFDRVFIDDAVVNTGDTPATTRTWLGQEANGFMTYFDTRSSQEVISSIGGIALATGSRSSDNDRAGERNTIGLGSYTLNDGSANTVWGIYSHSVLSSEDSVATFVAELNVANASSSVVSVTPYSLGINGVTSALRLRSGGETAESGITCQPASVAMDIAHPNIAGATFDKGIVVQNGALSSSVGTKGHAVFAELPTGVRYQWKFGPNSSDLGGFLTCSATASGSVAGIDFGNTGVNFCQADGVELLRFNPTSNSLLPVTTGSTALGLTSREFSEVNSQSYKTAGGLTGASGSFTSNDGKTITVTNGIITGIV